jgi:hypothetical protein
MSDSGKGEIQGGFWPNEQGTNPKVVTAVDPISPNEREKNRRDRQKNRPATKEDWEKKYNPNKVEE